MGWFSECLGHTESSTKLVTCQHIKENININIVICARKRINRVFFHFIEVYLHIKAYSNDSIFVIPAFLDHIYCTKTH